MCNREEPFSKKIEFESPLAHQLCLLAWQISLWNQFLDNIKFDPHKVKENLAIRLITAKFQSWPNELKFNMQGLLTLLIMKISHLSILDQNCGSLCSNRTLIFSWCRIEARLLHKLPQFWSKIDKWDIFIIRRVKRPCILNFSSFGQLWNFAVIKRIAKFSFTLWGLNFDVIEKLISQADLSWQ